MIRHAYTVNLHLPYILGDSVDSFGGGTVSKSGQQAACFDIWAVALIPWVF